MSCHEGMDILFQHAASHAFEAFDTLFAELERSLPFGTFWEAYLMRAQIKLFSSDPTVVQDLLMADQAGGRPEFECLNGCWEPDTSNRLIVFANTPDMMQDFLDALLHIRDTLRGYFGEQGDMMARIMQCNLLYFMGEPLASLAVADEPYSPGYENQVDILLLTCMQYRCCLALGRIEEAEEYIMEAIRLSKTYPECVAPYQSFREWANITTNWNGESPRFVEDDEGKWQPNWNDRLEFIRKGAARTTRLEAPFVNYAGHHYGAAETLRQFYMNVFNGAYWLSLEDYEQAEAYFGRMSQAVESSGIIMPVVECGAQIMPLLRYMQQRGTHGKMKWLEKAAAMARQYEKALEAYRASNV